jgi:hypothetical protein
MAVESATETRGVNPSAPGSAKAPGDAAASSSAVIASWPEYAVDAFQRSVLFLDLLRQRGNEEIKITSRPMATVLRFDHEVLMDGRSLQRPINYVHRGVQKIHPFNTLAPPESRKLARRRPKWMNLLSAPVH